MARLLAILLLMAMVPNAATANPIVMVTVLPDHSVQIEGKRYADVQSLTPKVREIQNRKPMPGFSVTLAPGSDIKALGSVISLLQKAGVEKLGFLIEPSSK